MLIISTNKLPKEKLQELKRYVFMELFSAALQACVDTFGPEDTTKMFQPYNKLSGHAIVINLEAKNRFPQIQDDLLRVAVQIYYIIPLVWVAEIRNGFMTANSFSADVVRCMGQNLPEICEDCNILGQAQAETINPTFQFDGDMGLRKGLGRCKITIKRKGAKLESVEGIRTCILPIRVTEEEIDFWPIHYLMGYTYYATTLMADALGEEKTKEIMGRYLENAGSTVALRLKQELGIKEDDVRGAGAIITFLSEISTHPCELTLFTPDVVKGTITRCSFHDLWTCYTEKRIADGVCKIINPDYEFEHEAMMAHGDMNCRWVIKKR